MKPLMTYEEAQSILHHSNEDGEFLEAFHRKLTNALKNKFRCSTCITVDADISRDRVRCLLANAYPDIHFRLRWNNSHLFVGWTLCLEGIDSKPIKYTWWERLTDCFSAYKIF
jgi:hypothetical protein